MKKWIIVLFSVLVIASAAFYLSLNRIDIASDTEEITLKYKGDFFHPQSYEPQVITDSAQIETILESINQVYSIRMDSINLDMYYYQYEILFGEHSIHVFGLDEKYFIYDNVVYKVMFGDFEFLLNYEWIPSDVSMN